jgi:hypothetical protein
MVTGKKKQCKNIIWSPIVILLVVIIFVPISQAQQPVDFTDYFYAIVTYLSTSQELTIFQSDVKGVIRDNLENKKFNNLTSHCLRLARISEGKLSGTTYSKFTDSDGDYFITETISENAPATAPEASWKFIQGIGKWKGITGGGIAKFIFMTREKQQTSPTTFQGNLRMTGTFELPK